jgi:hypothetical protein
VSGQPSVFGHGVWPAIGVLRAQLRPLAVAAQRAPARQLRVNQLCGPHHAAIHCCSTRVATRVSPCPRSLVCALRHVVCMFAVCTSRPNTPTNALDASAAACATAGIAINAVSETASAAACASLLLMCTLVAVYSHTWAGGNMLRLQ